MSQFVSPIIHQMQPTGSSCICACVAMLTGKPVEEVVDKYHVHFFNNQSITLRDILEEEQFTVERGSESAGDLLAPGHVYLLTVPSLNLVGLFHEIIVDYREAMDVKVFDPAQGRKGARFYTLDNAHEDPKSFILASWIIDYKIVGVN